MKVKQFDSDNSNGGQTIAQDIDTHAMSASLGATFGYLGRPYFMGSYQDPVRSIVNGALVGVVTPLLILAFTRLIPKLSKHIFLSSCYRYERMLTWAPHQANRIMKSWRDIVGAAARWNVRR